MVVATLYGQLLPRADRLYLAIDLAVAGTPVSRRSTTSSGCSWRAGPSR